LKDRSGSRRTRKKECGFSSKQLQEPIKTSQILSMYVPPPSSSLLCGHHLTRPRQYFASLQSTPPKHFSLSKSLISHNPRSAGATFRRAAFLDHAPSQIRVGLAHRTGDLGLAIDQPLSLHYLHLAARRGLAQADYEIANALFWGSPELLARYPRRAYAHARRAAEDEWAEAFALLGMAYEQAVGVDKDLKMACSWYLRGASAGDVYAERKVEVLKGRAVFGFRKASNGARVTS
jgi:hypothetical protein